MSPAAPSEPEGADDTASVAGEQDRDTREIERLAWILDEAVRLPGGYRIGLDGLVGLIPGVGDVLGLGASTYIVLTARRLGAPRRVLARMTWNVLLESVIGTVPVVGDLFDFAWKANTRNIELLRRHYRSTSARASSGNH